jgi:hypothetical protein
VSPAQADKARPSERAMAAAAAELLRMGILLTFLTGC